MQNINVKIFFNSAKQKIKTGQINQNEFAVLTYAIKTTARKYIKEQEEAATKIQALFRGHLVRKDPTNKKQEATKIQALFRGHLVRKIQQIKNRKTHPKKI